MKKYFTAFLSLLAAGSASAINPFVQTCFTTDPAPMVHNDTLYVYTGHDEDNASFFEMYEWRVYSTTDMANWTDHGSPLSLEDFTWADDRAWAPQCIERNGKFYFYVPVHSKLSGGMAIGVAVGDTPTGPFRDAIGGPLVDGSWDYIDPTVFIDDDGQAYLYWGNPKLYYVKLNEDMISYSGKVEIVKQTAKSFGNPPSGSDSESSYTEGPWFFKRNGKYYMVYAAGGIPEHIAYSMSDGPTGPWEYKGVIMPSVGELKSFTNHSGITDYKGESYFFYHSGVLPGGGGFDRSVCVEKFKFNEDGTIPKINPTDKGPAALGNLDPYGRIEAETIYWAEGVKSKQSEDVGVYISKISNGDYIRIANVDFTDDGAKTFGANVASRLSLGKLEVRLDSKDGTLVAEMDVAGTGGWDVWKYVEVPTLKEITGKHDLYFVFSGRSGVDLFNFDYWTFSRETAAIEELRPELNGARKVVYNMQGIKVLETEDESQLSTLPHGFYIINGKKTLLQ